MHPNLIPIGVIMVHFSTYARPCVHPMMYASQMGEACARCVIKKNWFMLLAVRISSYGCTWEVWGALKKLELLSATPRAALTLLSCSPNFPRASITRYTHAKHEPILNFSFHTLSFAFFPFIYWD